MLFAKAGSAWDFFTESLKVSPHYPRPGEGFRFQVDMPGRANQPFVLALSLDTRPGIPLLPVPGSGVEMLPLAPNALFRPSLQANLVTVPDGLGKGSVPMGIPNDKSFLWLKFHASGFAVRPGSGFPGVSNRVPLQVVR